MKVKIHNKGKKDVVTPYPSRKTLGAGRKTTLDVKDTGTEALAIMSWAVVMKARKVQVQIIKDGKTYEAISTGSMPQLKEV